MSGMLTDQERAEFVPSDLVRHRTPIPTQVVSSDEVYGPLFAVSAAEAAEPDMAQARASPQWQIEGLRRLEIPEAMQKQRGFTPLGDANGPVKTAILGGNNARLYNVDPQRTADDVAGDRFVEVKRAYEADGPERSKLRYGYVVGPLDPSVFA